MIRAAPITYTVKYTTRLVSDIGIGPIGIDNGANMHVTAAISAIKHN